MRTYNKLRRHPFKFPYVATKRFVRKSKEKVKSAILHPATIGLGLTNYATYSFFAKNWIEAIASTGVAIGGAIAYFATSPDNDIWPFTEIEDRVYQPLQWFNGSRGPVLEGPGTSWFFRPLVKKIKDKDRNIVFVSAQYQERPCDFPFRTKDGLEGRFQMQYLYKVPNKKNAKKYFWEYGAQPSKIDEIVKGELSARIGSIEGRFVAQGKYIDANNNLINYLEEAEINANKKLLSEKELDVGVEVKNFAILHIDFDPDSERILQQEVKSIEAGKATIQKAIATAGSIDFYRGAARRIAGPKATEEEITRIALFFIDRDNNQEVGETGGTIVKVTEMFQNPIFIPSPQKKKRQPPSSP